jgi:hypothetical protein
MTPAWLLPTARATSWEPLAAVATLLVVLTATSAYADRWPLGLVGVVAAGLAAAVVAGLRDPAAALLSAVPTSPGVRRARRLVLLLPAGLATWLAWIGWGHRWAPEVGWPVGSLAALTATGLAVAVWAPPRVGVAAGVAVPLAWVAATTAGGALGEDHAQVLFGWQCHPELVTVAAAAAVLLGRNR